MSENEELLRTTCGTTNPLLLKLRGGGVVRYHTDAGCRKQSVAEHSWRVAVILHTLWPDRVNLILPALYHDVAEGLVGDMPAPVKRVTNGAKDIEKWFERFIGITDTMNLYPDADDYTRLKCADYLELVATTTQQNTRDAQRIMRLGAKYVEELADKLPPADKVLVIEALHKLAVG